MPNVTVKPDHAGEMHPEFGLLVLGVAYALPEGDPIPEWAEPVKAPTPVAKPAPKEN